jgi:protein TonB
MNAHMGRALGTMALGTVALFAAVVSLNELADPLEKREAKAGDTLNVTRPPKSKPKPTVKKIKPKPRKRRTAPPPPNLAAFAAGLSGIDVGLPAFDFSSLGGARDALLGDSAKDVAMTSDTVDEAPLAVERSPLEYPADLRRRGIQGYVILSLLVSTEGEVEMVQVVESSPPGVFDEFAENAVRSWRFVPGKYKGTAVKTWVRQRVSFELS